MNQIMAIRESRSNFTISASHSTLSHDDLRNLHLRLFKVLLWGTAELDSSQQYSPEVNFAKI